MPLLVMIWTTSRPMDTSRESRAKTVHTPPTSSSLEITKGRGAEGAAAEEEGEEIETAPPGRFSLMVGRLQAPAGRGPAV